MESSKRDVGAYMEMGTYSVLGTLCYLYMYMYVVTKMRPFVESLGTSTQKPIMILATC